MSSNVPGERAIIVSMTGSPAHGARLRPGLVAGLLFALALGSSGSVSAEPPPAKGKLLVASRELEDPNFRRSVVLLTRYSDQGAMGLVVNRPTTILPEEVLPEVEGLAHYSGPLFFGGPVEIGNVLFLVRTTGSPEPSQQVFGEVHLSGSRSLLGSLASDPQDASKLRVYAGYAGWGPGQLDHEILRGGWHVVPASEDVVFAEDPESVWEKVLPMPEPLTAGLPPLRPTPPMVP